MISNHEKAILSMLSFVGSLIYVHALQCVNPDVATTKLQNYLDLQGTERFCEIGSTKHGRGLVATRNLQPGEVVLRIPLSCVLMENDDKSGKESWAGRLASQLTDRNQDVCFYKAALPTPPCTPIRGDWPQSILQEFECPTFLEEIDTAQDWRYQQWTDHCGSYADRQSFLDTLDLVCSRTIRVGNKLMLVPLLDMANHASRPQGGGYYKQDGSHICLHVGERGVRMGDEVTLDYGQRSNEDWVLHYGFLPDRNNGETVPIEGTKRLISWKDVGTDNVSLRNECRKHLENYKTTIEEDLNILRDGSKINDFRLEMAISYRVNQKILLNAIVGGTSVSSNPTSSIFSSLAFAET